VLTQRAFVIREHYALGGKLRVELSVHPVGQQHDLAAVLLAYQGLQQLRRGRRELGDGSVAVAAVAGQVKSSGFQPAQVGAPPGLVFRGWQGQALGDLPGPAAVRLGVLAALPGRDHLTRKREIMDRRGFRPAGAGHNSACHPIEPSI
jgi:hypothetical protein